MGTAQYPAKNLVLFRSALAYDAAPNITHITMDGMKTACGRGNWAAEEGWNDNGPDCLRCRKAWERCRKAWDALPSLERGM